MRVRVRVCVCVCVCGVCVCVSVSVVVVVVVVCGLTLQGFRDSRAVQVTCRTLPGESVSSVPCVEVSLGPGGGLPGVSQLPQCCVRDGGVGETKWQGEPGGVETEKKEEEGEERGLISRLEHRKGADQFAETGFDVVVEVAVVVVVVAGIVVAGSSTTS